MFTAPLRVVLDANVLFPMTVRDTLLRAAEAGMYQVYWSERILDEATRNLVASGRMSEQQAERLRKVLCRAFPEASVVGYEPLIDAMLNDDKDRHVAAVAVRAGAAVIVTSNLKDFVPLPDGVEATSPDAFLLDLLEFAPDAMVSLLRRQVDALKNPPVTLDQLLTGLGKTVPEFEKSVRQRLR